MSQAKRTIRLFVSSTFGDMKKERDVLQREVFPKLRALCVEHGLRFQAIDLRWGVTEESRRNNRTMSVCLRELRRCQAGEVRPDFLILLGDRYGWLPRPEAIPPEVFTVLTQRVAPEARSLLETWYRRDDNAVPTCYWLQPRTGAAQDPVVWVKTVEQPLMAALQSAAASLAADASISPELKAKVAALGIGLSATHHEILYGALLLPADQVRQHVHAFVRTIQYGSGDKPHRDFGELRADGTPDPEARDKINRLRADLAAHLSKDNLHSYEAAWREGGQFTEADLENFRTKAYATLEQVILGQIAQLQSRSVQAQEEQAHLDFGAERREGFVGREDLLGRLDEYLANDDRNPLPILGAAGSGKSALMAEAVARARTQHSGALIIERYLGTTPESSKAEVLLRNLLGSLRQVYSPSDEPDKPAEDPASADFNALVKAFQEGLKLVTVEKPLIVFLDALDQLADSNITRWLPQELPEHVRFVVSTALPASDAPAQSPQSEVTRSLEQLVPEANRLSLGKLEPVHGRALLERWLQLSGRTLQPRQREAVLQAFAVEGNPLWLRMAAEQCTRLTSWAEAPVLPASLPTLIGEMLDQLASEQHHGAALVERALGYLACSRHGLAEDEWLDLLSCDPEVMADFRRRFPKSPPVDSIPSAVWVAFLGNIMGFLGETQAQGALLFRYYHRCIFEVALERFLATPNVRQQRHRAMADYFTANARGALGTKPWDSNHARGFAECLYHRIQAGEASPAWAVFKDFAFLIQKTRLGLLDGVLEDVGLLRKDGELSRTHEFSIVESFFREKGHILRRGDDEWPAYKILLQLAVEHADDSPLTIRAEKWLANGRCDWVWLKRNQRLRNAQINPCLAVFEGHKREVEGALELRDGRLLSWSLDGLLRLWNLEGQCVAQLQGDPEGVGGALELRDGRLVSWSHDFFSKDCSLCVWNAEGQRLGALEGHSSGVIGAFELHDGRLLSWSNDKTLREWNTRGQCLAVHDISDALILSNGKLLVRAQDQTLRLWSPQGQFISVFNGHAPSFTHALELLDGRFLVWSGGNLSNDPCLHLWNREGNCCVTLEGHSHRINGALELRDGRLLSWSIDKTLRLWSPQGQCTAVLNGHSHIVGGALELGDGRLLSWSYDKTLRLWSPQGQGLAVLEGHSHMVSGALELRDGRMFSWAGGLTMRLWSREGACVAVLKGHSGIQGVLGVRELHDGRLLSWAGDHTLRLWTLDTQFLAALEAHSSFLVRGGQLRDGRLLTWAGYGDSTMRLWSQEGECTALFEGHADNVDGAIELLDGRLLSWASEEGALRLWSPDGKCVAVLQGHKERVRGALELRDGKLLSWAGDHTLRLWDPQGRSLAVLHGSLEEFLFGVKKLHDGRVIALTLDHSLPVWDQAGNRMATLKGHSGRVANIRELRNGNLLSWSADGTLRIWNTRGHCVAILRGHTAFVNGVQELRDGRLLSWAQDKTLRLWTQGGRCVAEFRGHTNCIDGVLELRDGTILSWSSDKTLCRWSPPSPNHQTDPYKIVRWLEPLLRPRILPSAPSVVVPAGNSPIAGVAELPDGRLISWEANYQSLRLWNPTGEPDETMTLEEGLRRYQMIRENYYGLIRIVSHCAFVGASHAVRILVSTHSLDSDRQLIWQADSECCVCHLRSGGRAIFTQENGQVCFLQAHHGNRPITIAELEMLFAK